MIPADCLLFDLDGTLIDSRADLARSINLMLADLGRAPLPESQVVSFVGDGVWVLVSRALTATDPKREAPDQALHKRALTLMREHYSRQMLISTTLFPTAAETLEYFSSKRMALVTSKESDFARQILDHFGISRYFESIVGGETVAARKPDPAPVLKALDSLGGKPERALMIGDSENDVMAGQRAGAHSCAVTYGFRTREQLVGSRPEIIIDHLDELKRFIRS